MMEGLIVDLFAGGGGASAGLEAALGRPVDIGINHDPIALAVHKANHPNTRHLEADIWEVKPEEATEGRPVAILWASPDCTHHSVAKGGKPRSQKIRSLAWAVTRWAKAVRPSVIFVENVGEFQGWGPLTKEGKPDKRYKGKTFKAWVRRLERLGYTVEWRKLDASHYGAPTRRRRLFLIAPVRRPPDPVARGDARCRQASRADGRGVHRLVAPVSVDLRAEASAGRENTMAHRPGHPAVRVGGSAAVHRRDESLQQAAARRRAARRRHHAAQPLSAGQPDPHSDGLGREGWTGCPRAGTSQTARDRRGRRH